MSSYYECHHILTVKLPEKGDWYSKIAKLSILLLCAVALGVRGKEILFIVNLIISYKETL